MYSVRELIKVQSIQEAKDINQKRFNTVIGGGLWLRLGKRKIGTAIDLSQLNLNHIEEREADFLLGSMVSLRQLEMSESLNAYFNHAFKSAFKGIIGVQFRNSATLGGSVYARFGFSDVVALLLGLKARVILDGEIKLPLEAYVQQSKDNHIITHIIIPKENQEVYYYSFRKESVDFPVVNGAVVKYDKECHITLGARPQVAKLVKVENSRIDLNQLDTLSEDVIEEFSFDTNLRGSKEYRRHLGKVLIQRGLSALYAKGE